MREYDLIAEWYASARGGATGVPDVAALASSLPRGARIADIGCGTGIPLTRTLLDTGHSVVGLDRPAAMLARFRTNYLRTPSVHASALHCPFLNGVFDAAVAWGVMFHLRQNDQQTAANCFACAVRRPSGYG
jgi:SAM-dependent methyltransferase